MQMLLSGHRHVLARPPPHTAKRRRVACCAAEEASIKVLDRFWHVGAAELPIYSYGCQTDQAAGEAGQAEILTAEVLSVKLPGFCQQHGRLRLGPHPSAHTLCL